MHQENIGEGKPTLYVVATPIGNLRDISLRALDVLRGVPWVASEDTRVTAKLLHHYAISARLIALHRHNERAAAQKIVGLLAQGQSGALVADAGTPAISDPGALAVEAARAAGFAVVPLPGASALTAALSVAGPGAERFLFHGFLAQQGAERRRELERLARLPYLLVFYEAPHRVLASVADMRDILGGGRRIVIARELTKIFETVHCCTLAQAPEWLAADTNRLKGEFVLLVGGAAADDGEERAREARRVLQILLAELPLKQAVSLAAAISGEGRKGLYQWALQGRE